MSIAASPMENTSDHGKRNITQLTPDQMIIPNILNDIAIEILSRLPHESLFKFSSVCKTWQSLFLNPSFIKLHEDNQNESLLVLSVDTTTFYYLTFLLDIKNPKTTLNLDHPFHKLANGMDVVGSINGLICLSCEIWAEDIVIWNPVTKQYKELPRPRFIYTPGTMYNISLGFCFHSPMSDYVVIRIARFERNEKIISLAELYSLNSDSWREIENEVDFPILFSTCDTIVKGEPYWWACFKLDGPVCMMRFDICDKIFRQVPKFRVSNRELERCKLVNYKSLLAVLVDSNLTLSSLTSKLLGLSSLELRESERTLTMFVLGNEESWRVGLRIGFPQGIERVIGCSNNGRIIFEDKLGMIVLFDTKREQIENINIVGAIAESFTVCNYTASFVSIKGSERAKKQRHEDSYMGEGKRPRYSTDPVTEA